MLGRSGAAEATVNIQNNLDAIAYALIGGGSFSGGKVSIAGSMLAILSVIVLMNILGAAGLGTHPRDFIKGILLVSIIIINKYRATKARQIVKA